MPYITLDDYVLSVSNAELNDILTQATTGYSITEEESRLKSESLAESKIRNFLSSKYNLDIEFIKTGSLRNMSLVKVYVDLSLCALYNSVSPDDSPEKVSIRCKSAIDDLMMWRDGENSLSGVDEIATSVSQPTFDFPFKFISKPFTDPLIFEEAFVQILAPSLLTLDSVTPTQADLSWTTNSANEESGFQIDRSLDNINFNPLVILPTGTIVYVDTTVTTGITHYFKVKALGNEIKTDSDFSNVLIVVVP